MSVVGVVSFLYVRVRDHTHILTLAQQAVSGAISSALRSLVLNPRGLVRARREAEFSVFFQLAAL